MKQTGVLFLHLGEFIFIADDDNPAQRVWADESIAVAELTKEGWMITSGPVLIEPDLPGNAGRNAIGYRLERSIQ